MTERQFEGRSVAEAAIKACEVLGLTRSALRYKVISETGELLERRVVIAVENAGAPVAPEVPDARRLARPPAGETASEGGGRDAPDTDASDGAPDGAPRQRSRPPSPRRGAERGERRDRGGRRPERGERDDRQARGSRSGRSAGGSRGRDRDRPRPADDDGIEALLKLDAQPVAAIPRRPAIEAASPRAKRAVVVAGDLVRLMGLQLTAHLVADQDAELHIDIVGADESRVIGRKGEVLLALQFVTNRIISRGEEESDQVVVLDAGGYRERRRTALEELAKRLATRALQERKAVRLSPMSAHDRRVFHMTVKTMEGVTTRSEGDGLFRNLLIIPSEFC